MITVVKVKETLSWRRLENEVQMTQNQTNDMSDIGVKHRASYIIQTNLITVRPIKLRHIRESKSTANNRVTYKVVNAQLSTG